MRRLRRNAPHLAYKVDPLWGTVSSPQRPPGQRYDAPNAAQGLSLL